MKQPPKVEYMTREYRLELINLMHARVQIDGKQHTVIRAIEIMVQSIMSISEQGDMKHSNFQILSNIHFINHEL